MTSSYSKNLKAKPTESWGKETFPAIFSFAETWMPQLSTDRSHTSLGEQVSLAGVSSHTIITVRAQLKSTCSSPCRHLCSQESQELINLNRWSSRRNWKNNPARSCDLQDSLEEGCPMLSSVGHLSRLQKTVLETESALKGQWILWEERLTCNSQKWS